MFACSDQGLKFPESRFRSGDKAVTATSYVDSDSAGPRPNRHHRHQENRHQRRLVSVVHGDLKYNPAGPVPAEEGERVSQAWAPLREIQFVESR